MEGRFKQVNITGQRKSTHPVIPLLQSSQKCKLMCGDGKGVGSCPERAGAGRAGRMEGAGGSRG